MTETVKVLITGDFYGGGRINDLILKGDYKAIFNDFLPIIKESDIAITNLESPLTKEIKAIQKTGPSITSPLETANAHKSADFNHLTLAKKNIMV